MKFRLLLLSTLGLLSGCAHYCETSTFYKLDAPAAGIVAADSSSPETGRFTLGPASFTGAICGGRRRGPLSEVVALCVWVEIDDSTVMQLAEPLARLSVGNSSGQIVAIGDIEYHILCSEGQGGRQCSSTEESPISGDVHLVSRDGAVSRYAFASTLAFRGAADTQRQGAWFGHRTVGKRSYLFRTSAQAVKPGSSVEIVLPSVILNGQTYAAPPLRFRVVTQDVCRTVVLQG